MEGSSLECRPNLTRKKQNKKKTSHVNWWSPGAIFQINNKKKHEKDSPSTIVKVQQKSIVAKLLKCLIVMSVHVTYGEKTVTEK